MRGSGVHGLVSMLLLFAVALIALYMFFYFRNVWLAVLGIAQICLSFPIMTFLVSVVFQQRPLNDVIFPQHTRCTLYSAPHDDPVVRL